jgi:hypothetical protein
MRLNSLWVSLDFEWIWTFCHGETSQPPSELGLVVADNELGPVVANNELGPIVVDNELVH